MASIAVKGCTLEISPCDAVSLTIKSQPSSNVKIGENGVYKKEIKITAASLTLGSTTAPSANLTITANTSMGGIGEKVAVQADGDDVLVEGDNNGLTGEIVNFTDSSSGATVPTPVMIKISKAGQTDVDATVDPPGV